MQVIHGQRLRLSLTPGMSPKAVHLSQYDEGLRAIFVSLVACGEELAVPEGVAVEVRGTKPDGYGFSYPCTVQNNAVMVPVTRQMTACAGSVTAEIVLIQEGGVLATANFLLEVERAALDEKTIQSTDDYKSVQQYAADAESAKNAAVTAAGSATTKAGEAAASAATAAEKAAALAASTAQIAENTAAIGRCAGAYTATDSGSLVTVKPVAAQLAKALVLHGKTTQAGSGISACLFIGGKNIIDEENNVCNNGIHNTNGTLTSASETQISTNALIPCVPNATYTFSTSTAKKGTTWETKVAMFDSEKKIIRVERNNLQPRTFTTDAACRFLRVGFYDNGGTFITSRPDLQLEAGSQAAAHEDFCGYEIYRADSEPLCDGDSLDFVSGVLHRNNGVDTQVAPQEIALEKHTTITAENTVDCTYSKSIAAGFEEIKTMIAALGTV